MIRRGTAYGLSAAIGKTGAAVGTEAFRPIQNNLGKKVSCLFVLCSSFLALELILASFLLKLHFIQWTFIISAIIGVLGVAIALLLVPDTTKLNLEDEDEKWRQYLLKNGWDSQMGDGTTKTHKASEIVTDEDGNIKLNREESGNDSDADRKI